MSLHKSLVYRLSGTGKRNVLSRKERIDILMATDKLPQGASVFGLPKVKPESRLVLLKRRPRERSSESQE